MRDVVGFIYNSELSNAIRIAGWVIPAIQTIHILAIAGLLSSAILLNLRLVGWLGESKDTLPILGRFLKPAWASLGVLFVSGGALLWAEPDRVLLNQSFWIKMALVVVGIILLFTTRQRLMLGVENGRHRRSADYVVGISALFVWASVIVYGRWIAYTY